MFDDIQIEEMIDELEEMDLFDVNDIYDITSSWDEYWLGHEMEEDIMF